jgi:hypothetical protein
VLSRASLLDRPKGYNTASSACPLQRTLQGVTVQVAEGLFDTRPQLKALVVFVACAWQQLHKRGGHTPVPPWGSAAACIKALTPSNVPGNVPLPPRVPDPPWWTAVAGTAPSAHGRSRAQASAPAGSSASGRHGRVAIAPVDLSKGKPGSFQQIGFGR